MSDIDTVVVGGLKALDPKRPIREADIELGRLQSLAALKPRSRHVRNPSNSDVTARGEFPRWVKVRRSPSGRLA